MGFWVLVPKPQNPTNYAEKGVIINNNEINLHFAYTSFDRCILASIYWK